MATLTIDVSRLTKRLIEIFDEILSILDDKSSHVLNTSAIILATQTFLIAQIRSGNVNWFGS